MKNVARGLNHIGCFWNSHGFPGRWSWTFYSWETNANRLNGWAQADESKKGLVKEFREEFIESRRQVLERETLDKVFNQKNAQYKRQVIFTWAEDVFPIQSQVNSEDAEDSFDTADEIDEDIVEGFGNDGEFGLPDDEPKDGVRSGADSNQ